MKKLLIVTLVFFIAVYLAGCAAPPPKIGIMEMEEILQKSKTAQGYQQELVSIGNKLQEDYDQVNEKYSGEKKNEEQEKIYQEYLNNKQRLEEKLNQEITKIISDLAEEEGLDIVVYKKSVYYGGVDITDDVIKRLDKTGDDSDGEE